MRVTSRQKTCDCQHEGDAASRQRGDARLFAAATLLARKGRYADASTVLRQALEAGECSDAQALDLQARMYAQQGLYLDAESCWRKAQSLDGSNTAYADALDRLRQERQPGGRFRQSLAVLCGLLAIGLLVWQVARVNPELRRRQDTVDKSLAAIRSDIHALTEGSASGNQAAAASTTKIAGNVRDLGAGLAERLKTMPTTAEAAEHRDALAARIGETAASLQKAVARQTVELAKRQDDASAALAKRVDRIEPAVAEARQALTDTAAALAKRIDAVQAGISGGMKALASSADVIALQRSLAKMEERIAQLGAAINEPGRAKSGNATSVDPASTQPTTQPPPHAMPE